MSSCPECGYVFVLPDEDCPRCARAPNVLSILPGAQPQPSPRKARRGLPWAIAALVASLVLLAVAWCTFGGRREVSGGSGTAGGTAAVGLDPSTAAAALSHPPVQAPASTMLNQDMARPVGSDAASPERDAVSPVAGALPAPGGNATTAAPARGTVDLQITGLDASRYPELDLSLSGSLPTDDRTSLVLFYALNYARDMDAAIDDLLKERASTGIPYLGKTIVTPDNSMAKLDSTSLWVRGGHAIAQLHLTSARDFRGPVQLAVQIRNRPDKDGLCAPRSRVFTQMVWPGH